MRTWEVLHPEFENIPFNRKLADYVKKNRVRVLIKKNDSFTNNHKGRMLLKHLINGGVSPTATCMTSLEDCYLSVRGFGEQGKIKKTIFDPNNQAILITNVREIRKTDVLDNVHSFWTEFWDYLSKYPHIQVIMTFNVDTTEKHLWYPIPEGSKTIPHKILGFTEI